MEAYIKQAGNMTINNQSVWVYFIFMKTIPMAMYNKSYLGREIRFEKKPTLEFCLLAELYCYWYEFYKRLQKVSNFHS